MIITRFIDSTSCTQSIRELPVQFFCSSKRWAVEKAFNPLIVLRNVLDSQKISIPELHCFSNARGHLARYNDMIDGWGGDRLIYSYTYVTDTRLVYDGDGVVH